MTENKNDVELQALESSKPDTTHSFCWALEQLKAGKKVHRRGWNALGMWLVLIPADQWSTSVGPNMHSVPRAHRLPWIAMKTADDGLVPWLASQTDMLAEDWGVSPKCPMCGYAFMEDWDEIAAYDESFRNHGTWEDFERWRAKQKTAAVVP